MRNSLHHSRNSRRAAALVVTLCFLVLLTGVIVAYFSRTESDRKLSASSTNQSRADELSRSALHLIIADLKQEIRDGSTEVMAGNSAIYLPKNNSAGIPNLLAVRNGVPPGNPIPNLIRRSTRSDSIAAPGVASRASHINSTADSSLNRRAIARARWNKHCLVPRVSGAGTNDTTPIPEFESPDWVIMTRSGPIPFDTWDGSLANSAPQNSNFAIGRYAYAIYDQSGLLDLNAAGFPSSTTPAQNGGKGFLAFADLTGLGLTQQSIDQIVGWRNYASAQPDGEVSTSFTFSPASATRYFNLVNSNTSGFLNVASADWKNRTDQAFLSRQMLLDFLNTPAFADDPAIPAALQFVGTFSRSSDQPSYYPDPNRPKVNTSQDDIINPNVLKIRVRNTFTRPDGTTAMAGEPLLKHRFPLTRLALFADPITNAQLIKTYFAMELRPDGLWDYVDPDTHIVLSTLPVVKTLDLVASAGREPTYWELLQAGILTGSLGVDFTGTVGCLTSHNREPSRQVFSIGLSIIDQYDADDTPTVLRFAGTRVPSPDARNFFVSGVENVPYIMWLAQQHFRDSVTPVTPSTEAYIDGYLLFTLWNPHRDSPNASPGKFRIRTNGESRIKVRGRPDSAPVTHTDTTLTFQTSTKRTFHQIDALRATDAVAAETSPLARFPFPAGSGDPLQVGIMIGQIQAPKNYIVENAAEMNNAYSQPLTIVVEKFANGNWIPYQLIPYYNGNFGNNGWKYYTVSKQMNSGKFDASLTESPMVIVSAHSDPRTFRFGLVGGGGTETPEMILTNFNIIDRSGKALSFGSSAAPPGSPFSSNKLFLADYAYNRATGKHYRDRETTATVVRKADSNAASTTTHGVDSPYKYGDARPVTLNRPFRSVAEMGYAFRDSPWKTLDFSSRDSADSGLLDLFCLNENTNINRAGVVNLNTASKEVLTAILMNAYRDPAAANGTPLTAADAWVIAQAIQTHLGPPSTPLMVIRNVSDIVLLADKVATSLPDTFKFKREALVRALADVTNCRTWNLMIDVIAQSGKYSPVSKGLDDFVVEGERRYWMHVALDRFTGEVLETQIEPVFE